MIPTPLIITIMAAGLCIFVAGCLLWDGWLMALGFGLMVVPAVLDA